MPQQSRPLRILYAAGPGNVLGTYHHWVNNEDDPLQISVTYSNQFYDVCRSLGAEGYIISSFPHKAFVQDGQFTIEHRPKQFSGASGVLYHLSQILYGLQLVISAIQWRADVVVVADGTTHWFVLSLLTYFGISVVPSLHCVLWRKYRPQKKIERLLNQLSRRLFTRSASILVVSKDVAAQVQHVMGDAKHPFIREFHPFYRKDAFSKVRRPKLQTPFQALFIGRVEESKGVFDLLQVAKRFAAENRRDIQFHFCGLGSALEPLQQAVKAAGLESSMIFHQYCDKAQLQEQLNQSHVVVVPTTTTFVEGFNKVVAEGILTGRPVITSAVCPALSYVRSGAVEVQPDNVQEYGDAILKLRDDSSFYKEKVQGCLQVQDQFYDASTSWGNQLRAILLNLKTRSEAAQPVFLKKQTAQPLVEPIKR
ncbi:MAG: hypothetical protein Kow00121_66870 [Elainellaceae cyanobacterium]